MISTVLGLVKRSAALHQRVPGFTLESADPDTHEQSPAARRSLEARKNA